MCVCVCVCVCVCMHSVVSDLMDCSPPGSSVHGIFQAEYWSGLPLPPAGNFPNPETEPVSLASPALAGGFFTTSAIWEAVVRERSLKDNS